MEYSEVFGSENIYVKKIYKNLLFQFHKEGYKKNIKFLKVSCCNSIKLFYLFS